MLRIYLLSFLLHFTYSRVNKHLKISCGLEDVSRESVAMRFYIQLENKGKDCNVECIPDKCCLEQGNEEDCDVLQLFGGCLEKLPAGGNRTVRLAAPLLDPFERRGYCVLHLHSKVKGHRIYRDTVTIPFDTGKPSDATPCEGVDQDPLNDCQPVNCDTYYNGKKPHFSKRLKRCVETPPCSQDEIYDARFNRCAQSVTDDDIRTIKLLSKRKMRSSSHKNVTSRSVEDDLEHELFDQSQRISGNYNAEDLPQNFLDYLHSTKVLFCVICAQCFLVIALGYYVRKRCNCLHSEKKEVLSKFFHFRQNDSITTPLLNTSHGTVTTCQFQSDSSSNVDRKIQFYKACRKDKQAKASMSDDILSRCLKRRDWTTKPKSSEVIPENKEKEEHIQVYETEHISDRTGKSSNRRRSGVTVENLPLQISSEKQVKCFEYEDQNFYSNPAPKTHSLTENCAQACFSKDSIDDFLSERGLLSISASSKTSKDNVGNVLSLISHKHGPSSDPGGRSEDLELLHMSRMSFSSSNEDFDLKRTMESRSSL